MRKLIILFLGFLGGLVGYFVTHYLFEDTRHKIISVTPQNTAVNAKHVFFPNEINHLEDLTNAAETSLDAVVHIKSTIIRPVNNMLYWNPFFEFFYGNEFQVPNQTQISAGSGVVVSEDGYIVTNNHVIQDASKIEIILNNKKQYTASIIGTDPATDLALLKIDAQQLTSIRFADSDESKIGEWVLAVGNPFNLASTVTAGIISAKGRDIDILKNDYNTGTPKLEAFIQTDAAVNPGNSGGALVNKYGELVGINTAIKSNTGSYTGYAFAIPSNIVRKVIEDFLEYGEVQRGFLGIKWTDLTPEICEKLNIQDMNGVYINSVTKGSSADDANIESGDIIKALNKKPIQNITQLQENLAKFRPGDKVELEILRKNELIFKNVILKNKLGSIKPIDASQQFYSDYLSASFEPVEKTEAESLGITHGIRVTKINRGILQQIGIKEGYIIQKVNNKTVNSVQAMVDIIQNVKGGVLIEGVYPDGTYKPYAFGK